MELKVKFRDQLKENTKKTLGTDLGSLLPARQSKVMSGFYVKEIVRVFSPGLVPADEDDFENCIIDGPDDCGVDFLSRDEGTVLIIQTKFRGERKPQKLDEFVSFCEVLERLHPCTGKAYKKSRRLTEALTDIDWDNDFFDLQFITLGRVGGNILTRAEEGLTLGPELKDLEGRTQLTLVDENELNVRLREAISAGETIREPVTLRFIPDDGGSPWIKLETGQRSTFVGFVRGSEIADLYRPVRHRFRLFAMNIRDWIGDSATNKGIVSTAANRPDDFLFFNNGISAVATGIEEDAEDNVLHCRNFSIINGAQTVRSLFQTWSKKSSSLGKVAVMVRISTFSLGKEPMFLDDVTRYNNTQNKVAVSDFRSNDPVQRDLAGRFAKLKRGGVSFWYKNKRSRERRDRIPIEMEEFAKTVHAFKYGPHDMWGGSARLFDADKDGRYLHVFGDGESVWPAVPEEDFELLCGMWFLCEEVRRIWKEKKDRRSKDSVAGSALERRYMVFYGVAELLRMIYERETKSLTQDLRKLGAPKWTEKEGPLKRTIRELTDLAFTGLTKAYETASRAKDFHHRNWFRDRDYLEGIKSDLKFILDIKATGKEGLPLLNDMTI